MKKILFTICVLLTGLAALAQDAAPSAPKTIGVAQIYTSIQGGDTLIFVKTPTGWAKLIRYSQATSYIKKPLKLIGTDTISVSVGDSTATSFNNFAVFKNGNGDLVTPNINFSALTNTVIFNGIKVNLNGGAIGNFPIGTGNSFVKVDGSGNVLKDTATYLSSSQVKSLISDTVNSKAYTFASGTFNGDGTIVPYSINTSSTPTSGSSLPVTSGGVYTALQNYVTIASPQLTSSSTTNYVWTATDGSGHGSWQAVPAGFTNPMSASGDIIYGGSAGAATRLAGNTTTTKKFLTSTGTGSAANAPAYFDLFGTANTWGAGQTIGTASGAASKTGLSFTDGGNTYFNSGTSGFSITESAIKIGYASGTDTYPTDAQANLNIISTPSSTNLFHFSTGTGTGGNIGYSFYDYKGQFGINFSDPSGYTPALVAMGGDNLIIGSAADEKSTVTSVIKLFTNTTNNVVIGQSPVDNPVAILKLQSTKRGFLPPVMTQTQRDSLGVVTSILGVTGDNYTVAPTITLTGGGGTGATATCSVSFGFLAYTITNGGTGYTSAPTVVFTGGTTTGTPASATAVISLKNSNGLVVFNSTANTLNYYDGSSWQSLTTSAGTFVPLTRSININGTAQDLSADRSWSVGTVTSITPGWSFTSSTPITGTGTLTEDSTKVQTVLNLFPKTDTRYFTKTASDAKYELLSNKVTTLDNSATHYPSTSAVTSAIATATPVIKLNGGAVYNAFGDSFPAGTGSAPSSNDFANLTANYLNLTINNQAVSGTGAWSAASLAYANDSPAAFTSLMIGLNDVNLGSSTITTATKTKIANGYNCIIANHFIDSTFAGGNGSRVSETGTWTDTYTASTFGGKSVATGASSVASGATKTFVFYGPTLVLGLIGSDGTLYTYGTANITIDGVSQTAINENNQTDGVTVNGNDNGRMPFVILYSGFSEGAHTVVITTTSTNLFAIDYFGELKRVPRTNPFLYYDIAYVNATGQATFPHLSNSNIDAANATIATAVSQWTALGYPIYHALTNTYYNATTDAYTDNLHPSNIGHRHIYQAAYVAMSALQNTVLPQDLRTTASVTHAALTLTASQAISASANQTQSIGTSTNTFANIWSANFKSNSNLIFDGHASTANIFFQINGSTKAEMFSNGRLWLGASPSDDGSNLLQLNGSMKFEAAGNRLFITTGSGSIAGDATLSSGTVAITISGLTSSSRAQITRTVASGSSLTTGITAVCTTNTLTITADVAAGTINTADNSTYTYVVIN